MDANTVKIIENLASSVGKTGTDVVERYTTWFIASSIVWGLVGVLLIVFGAMVKFKEDREFYEMFPSYGIRIFIIAVGVLFLADNLVDLLAPEGIAIHQLIKDLRG